MAIPSDLIRDQTRTPFNIGRAIELHGFTLAEAQPLAQGFVGKVDNPQAVLREVLNWTGGQPFLTQKLCQLIHASEAFIRCRWRSPNGSLTLAPAPNEEKLQYT